MAHCPQLQIDRAYTLWRTGMHGHDDPTWAEDIDTRALKRGWSSGYTMGEDAGFDRGWSGAEWYFRPWWLKLWHRLRGRRRQPYGGRWMNDASYEANLEFSRPRSA